MYGTARATSLLSLLLLLTPISQTASPPTCTTTSGQSGLCISTATCSSGGGVSEAGHCSGASNIQCCTYGSCAVATLSGLCQPNTTCTSGGTAWGGYCGGDASILCCTYGSCTVGTGTAKEPGQCGLSTLCGADGGTSTGGLCGGPDGVRCCSYVTCTAGGKSGFCQTKGSCSGTSTGGSCPGGGGIQCCTPGTATVDGGPCGVLTVNQATLELIKGFEGWFPDICKLGLRGWRFKAREADMPQMMTLTVTRRLDGDICAMILRARRLSIPFRFPRRMGRSYCWTTWP